MPSFPSKWSYRQVGARAGWALGERSGDEQLFEEGHAQHIQVNVAIAEIADEGHKYFAVLQVVRVHKYHAIYRIHCVQVIYKVLLA